MKDKFPDADTLDDILKFRIVEALKANNGSLHKAAKKLGVSSMMLYRWMYNLGLIEGEKKR